MPTPSPCGASGIVIVQCPFGNSAFDWGQSQIDEYRLADFQSSSNLVTLKYQKSVIMATYMLCGFANFSSIGIQIGGIGSLAPNQRKTLSEFGIKALIGGALASLLSATIAGMLIG